MNKIKLSCNFSSFPLVLSLLLCSPILGYCHKLPESQIQLPEENGSNGKKNSKIEPQEELDQRTALAEKLNISLMLVQDLRKMNLCWEDISNLVVISKKAHQMIETVLVLKQGGFCWTEIAKRYHLDMDEIKRETTIPPCGEAYKPDMQKNMILGKR